MTEQKNKLKYVKPTLGIVKYAFNDVIFASCAGPEGHKACIFLQISGDYSDDNI